MTDLELAVELLYSQGHSVVAFKGGKCLGSFKGAGVKPFVELAGQAGPELAGAAVADRVIGRAVALACVHLGVAAVHAGMVSEGALTELKRAGIPVRAEKVVPYIENRVRTGQCPTEKLVQDVTDPAAALPLLEEFVAKLATGWRP